jgi:hypothetical protein
MCDLMWTVILNPGGFAQRGDTLGAPEGARISTLAKKILRLHSAVRPKGREASE